MPRALERIPLYHLFEHNAWATAQLFDFCEGLSEAQMAATAPGAVGSALDTLHHFVQAEGGYFDRLAHDLTPTTWDRFLARDFAAIRERAEEMETLWRTYTARDPDPSEIRRKQWPDVTHEFPAYMEMAQALFHSHTHREQVCMILTSIGLQPPDLQPLRWADERGVLRRIR